MDTARLSDIDLATTLTRDSLMLVEVPDGLGGYDSRRITLDMLPTGRELVVAAADAPAHVKAMADYVCDGTNDQVEIEAAAAALVADDGPGGTVLLSAGTFHVSALKGTSHVNLIGVGYATELKLPDSTSSLTITVDYVNITDFRIANLRVNGNKEGVSASSNPAMEVLSLKGCGRFRIENVWVRGGNGGDGLDMKKCSDFVVDTVRSYENGKDGIHPSTTPTGEGGDVDTDNCKRGLFRNCVAYDNGGNGLGFFGGEDLLVDGLAAFDNGSSGVSFYSGEPVYRNNTLRNIVLFGNASGTTGAFAVASGSSNRGITVDGLRIDLQNETGRRGISILGNATYDCHFRNVIIENIGEDGQGVRMTNGENLSVTNLVIRNIAAAGSGTSSGIGILLDLHAKRVRLRNVEMVEGVKGRPVRNILQGGTGEDRVIEDIRIHHANDADTHMSIENGGGQKGVHIIRPHITNAPAPSNGAISLTGSTSEGIVIEDGRIVTTSGPCVRINQTIGTRIRNVDVSGAGAITFANSPTDARVFNCPGFVTRNSGTATITSSNTSVAVNHGLDRTPNLHGIKVTPTNDLTDATKFWISDVTSSQFTINIDAAPGGGGFGTATFAWEAQSEVA